MHDVALLAGKLGLSSLMAVTSRQCGFAICEFLENCGMPCSSSASQPLTTCLCCTNLMPKAVIWARYFASCFYPVESQCCTVCTWMPYACCNSLTYNPLRLHRFCSIFLTSSTHLVLKCWLESVPQSYVNIRPWSFQRSPSTLGRGPEPPRTNPGHRTRGQ